MAVLKKFPEAKLGIGPTIDNGFYYDFIVPQSFSTEDLREFEKSIKKYIGAALAFSGEKTTPANANKVFKKQPFKLELIADFAKEKKPLTIYKTGDVFLDLCRGGHVGNTKEINPDAFKLTHVAGAYWKGSELNPQMQRIYGLAFETKDELDTYLKMRVEAEKRDHRKLGKELELFVLTEEVGPGLPLFYPKGAILRREIEDYITELQERYGYEPIWIPHVTKGALYKTSGHLDKYDALYPPMKLKGEDDYYLKPMNCPHFMTLYNTKPHSYRELPIRWTSTTTNYRYEKSGELAGLTRVRALTQDDCHVFARPDQIEMVINEMLSMIGEVYTTFDFKNFWVRISTHDPKNIKKYIGDAKVWADAEAMLKKVIAGKSWQYEVGEGEAAFYGPKLDFIFKDVLGREWQLSTIQLDMNLPKRFNLEYVDASGAKATPIVIHRAILGSTERFLGILIEHFGGAFPLWLTPLQVKILAVSEKFNVYAENVLKDLKAAHIRAELAPSDETLGKRIREAELQKIPYVLVIGEKEEANKTVNVRHIKRGGEGEVQASVLIEKILMEIQNKVI